MKNSLLTIMSLQDIRDLQKFVHFNSLGSFTYGSKDFFYALVIDLYSFQDGNYYLHVADNVNVITFWARFNSSISLELPFIDLRYKLFRAYNTYLNDLDNNSKPILL